MVRSRSTVFYWRTLRSGCDRCRFFCCWRTYVSTLLQSGWSRDGLADSRRGIHFAERAPFWGGTGKLQPLELSPTAPASLLVLCFCCVIFPLAGLWLGRARGFGCRTHKTSSGGRWYWCWLTADVFFGRENKQFCGSISSKKQQEKRGANEVHGKHTLECLVIHSATASKQYLRGG